MESNVWVADKYSITHITFKLSTEAILADLNRYTAAMRLVIILTNDTIKHTCIWPFAWRNKNKLYNSLTPLQWFLTLLFTSQREREAMKDERTTMAQWINLNQNNGVLICCVLIKNWPYPPTASGSYRLLVGLMAGRQIKYG